MSTKRLAWIVFALCAGAGVFAWFWSRRKVDVNATVTVDEEGVQIGPAGTFTDGGVADDGMYVTEPEVIYLEPTAP